MKFARTHKDLEVFQLSFSAAMEIFELTKSFPKEEKYSLTSQIRNSSRSVSANIAEGFRKRRYVKAFVAKLSYSEAEAAESQVWLDYAFECNYIDLATKEGLNKTYDRILGKIISMIDNSSQWSF